MPTLAPALPPALSRLLVATAIICITTATTHFHPHHRQQFIHPARRHRKSFVIRGGRGLKVYSAQGRAANLGLLRIIISIEISSKNREEIHIVIAVDCYRVVDDGDEHREVALVCSSAVLLELNHLDGQATRALSARRVSSVSMMKM